MKRLLPAALTVALLGVPGASATAQPSATISQSHAVVSADHVAAQQSADRPRGRLLDARPLRTAAALPSARRNYRVKYTSVGARGQRIVVTGTVSIPRGRAPRNGWPVISWAHGTTGTADVCAPSRDTITGPAHDYLGLMDQTLDRWVAKGFVVVKTDYEGLGTRGPHPYINGSSAANTVVDIVRAARDLNRRVGRTWFAIGHSQGGQAALFAAAQPQPRHDVHLGGAIAIAPGGTGISQTAPYIMSNQPGAQQVMGFLATILVGAAAADPAVDPRVLLTDEAETLLDLAESVCQAQLTQAGLSVPPTEAFEANADLGPLTAYLREQEPEHLTVRTPTMVAQGSADLLVNKPSTDFLVGELRERSDKVVYATYQGEDHRSVVSRSFADQLAFIKALLHSRRHR